MRTISDIHRQLYVRLKKANASPHIMDLLGIAFEMGKKMDNKMRQYQDGKDETWWKQNRLAGGEIHGKDDRTDPGFIVPDLNELQKLGRLPSWW